MSTGPRPLSTTGGDDGRHQPELLGRLVDSLPAMVAYWDADQCCRFANRAYERWFGVSPESLIGKTMKALLGPIYGLNLPYIEGALRGEEQQFEREIPDPAGGRPRMSQAHYIPDIRDGVVRGFSVLVADITHRKDAEEALRCAERELEDARSAAEKRALREAESERFRLVLEGAPTGMIVADLHGKIVLVNAQTEKLFGYGRDELVGELVDVLLPARFRQQHLEYRANYIADRNPRAMGRGRDLHGLRRDGSEVPVEIGLTPLETPDGSFVLASVVDISERKRAEQEKASLYGQLRELNVELEERVQSRTAALQKTLEEREALLGEKTSLLKEVHHRVKNNLQMISSLLKIQARKIADSDARASFLDAQGRVRSIALLHDSLYQADDLGRIDVRAYTEKLVSTLQRAYGEAMGTTRFVTAVEPVYLPVDVAVPCGLILNELATNALKHGVGDVHGDARPEIRIEIRAMNDDLSLSVADSGPGFPRTVDPDNDESMGLTLVRDLALQLRGRATFERSRGARCTVRFPVPGGSMERP